MHPTAATAKLSAILQRRQQPARGHITHVYHLVDPRCHTVRYVGKTKSPSTRLHQHIADAASRQATRKQQWIADLAAQALRPVILVVSSHPTDDAARQAESAECHRHIATIYNIHDPAKGASDLTHA